MNHSVREVANILNITPARIRGWLARSDVHLVERLTSGKQRISFNARELLALAVMRELTRYGLSPRDAGEFSQRIVKRVGAPPANMVAIVMRADAPVLEIVARETLDRIDATARLVIDLPALWRELTTCGPGRTNVDVNAAS